MKRKKISEITEEALGKIPAKDLRGFVKYLVEMNTEAKNAFLSWFFPYVDFGTRSLEAKYNALFRHLMQSYMRKGFLNYYSTMNLENNIEKIISLASDYLEKGRIDEEEAFVIGKCMLRNWIKNLNKMDDSSGSTYSVLLVLFGLFSKLYEAGMEEVFDFLIEEAQKEYCKEWGVECEIVKALIELVDSPEKAEKVLKLLDVLECGNIYKAELLYRFFPQRYEEFVHENLSDWQVAEFHLDNLIRKEAFEEALHYVDLVLSVPDIPRRTDFLKTRAFICERLGLRGEA